MEIENRKGFRMKILLNAFLAALSLLTGSLHADEPPTDATSKPVETYPALPMAITSFGAARVGDGLYAYGGNTGDAHSYWDEGQSNQLLKLDLKNLDQGWKTVAEGPRLQGLALVAFEDSVVRIGGFSALNKKGDKQRLMSMDFVSKFDLKSNKWVDLPKLPEPRSSHDAAIMDGVVYVVGGWMLRGEDETEWHTTAWKLDLHDASPKWVALAEPPFQRRALALSGHKDKLYVIGGMNKKGEPTTEVSVYDPNKNEWSDGPRLPGKGMDGFGAACWDINGKLIVSNIDGKLYKLDEAGSDWIALPDTRDARFFHRLLPLDDHRLISIGGANMESGKFTDPEIIEVQ
jgi:N-acetylneuraminic acid mutarotase